MVCLRVRDGGEEQLVYHFQCRKEAAEQMLFLLEFFPNATFLIEPIQH